MEERQGVVVASKDQVAFTGSRAIYSTVGLEHLMESENKNEDGERDLMRSGLMKEPPLKRSMVSSEAR